MNEKNTGRTESTTEIGNKSGCCSSSEHYKAKEYISPSKTAYKKQRN